MGQIFTMPFPIALGLWAMIHAFWPVVLAALAVRFATAWTISKQVLGTKLNWLLLPVEDLAAFGFWVAGFFGNTIEWRGRRYKLYADGQFELLT
jgi:ceramide glucosyltransferase